MIDQQHEKFGEATDAAATADALSEQDLEQVSGGLIDEFLSWWKGMERKGYWEENPEAPRMYGGVRG